MRVISVLLLVALGAVEKRGTFGLTIQLTATDSPAGHTNSVEENRESTLTSAKLAKHVSLDGNSMPTQGKTIEDNGELLPNTRPRRNSNPSGSTHGFTPTDYYLHIMSMLNSKNVGNQSKGRMQLVEGDTDFVDDEDEDEPIELYGGNPYPFISESAENAKRPSGNADKDTISLMRSHLPSPEPLENRFDKVGMTPRKNSERQARSPGRIGPVNGVNHVHVANSHREYSPFERRVFTSPFKRFAKSSFGSLFG